MLKLGWTYNMLHDDRDAVRWFDLARHSDDAACIERGCPRLQRSSSVIGTLPYHCMDLSFLSRHAGMTLLVTDK